MSILSRVRLAIKVTPHDVFLLSFSLTQSERLFISCLLWLCPGLGAQPGVP